MYASRYIQYINLPKIPSSLVADALSSINAIADNSKSKYSNYCWSDYHNQDINCWCQQNICAEMYWGFQVISGDLQKHCDIGTATKLSYLLSTGGNQVVTAFWDNDQTTLLGDYVIPEQQWHVLKADTYHSVSGVEPGQTRFSITGRIF